MPAANSIPATQAVRSTNALTFGLLRRLGGAGANVIFSPYSIETGLAMAGAGAEGETLSEIDRVLNITSASTFDASNASLAARLAAAIAPPMGAPAADAPRMNIANGLWVQSGLSLKPPFVSALSLGFAAAPQTTDFSAQPEAARQAINGWIAGRTADLIRNLLPQGTITVRTALVLANAIYLRAHWSSTFDPGATAPATFFTDAGARVTAPFMSRAATNLDYARGPGYQAVDLPYLYSDLSMLVVMPSARTLARFEAGLTPASLSALQRALSPRMVKLSMPRFHLIAHSELNAPLAALGMPAAFSDMADFSGITGQVPLKISSVQHGADLKVTEHGTVAAAATGVVVTPTAAAPSLATRVTLDHPFLLFLRDQRTGAILFAGRVADPTKS